MTRFILLFAALSLHAQIVLPTNGWLPQIPDDTYFSFSTNRLTSYDDARYERVTYQWGFRATGESAPLYFNGALQSSNPGGTTDISLTLAWNIQSHARDITIALLEPDGYQLDHPDLTNVFLPAVRIVGSTLATQSLTGPFGTMAAGHIAAHGNNAMGVSGVCRDGVKILPIQCASFADYGHALEYAVTNGANIVVFDLGYPAPRREWTNGFQKALDNGCLVVCAAPDEYFEYGVFPYLDYPMQWSHGPFTNLLTVSAYRMDGFHFTASAWSTNWIDVLAPGQYLPATRNGSTYTYESGTSAAAYIVAGVAALVWQKHPSWNCFQVLACLRSSAEMKHDWPLRCRYGGINALNALVWQKPREPIMLTLHAETNGVLETSTIVTGPWTELFAFTAPTNITITVSNEPQRFFRLL